MRVKGAEAKLTQDDMQKGCGNFQQAGPGIAKIHVEKMDMDSFTRFLSDVMGTLVMDKTGLTENYDFELTWDGREWAKSGHPTVLGPSPAGGERSNCLGADPFASFIRANSPQPKLAAALEDQLGLRLEPKKIPMQVVVIEQYEKILSRN